MSLHKPNPLRLFTREEAVKYLPFVRAYTYEEFGDDTFPIDYLINHRDNGVQFYQPYGDFSADPPKVLGLGSSMLISYQMYDDLLNGRLLQHQLNPWKPEDGKAILWVSSMISDMPGVLAKCISGMLEKIETHPYSHRIDRVGNVATGPQGYLLARTFGLREQGRRYKDSWLFMEREIEPGSLLDLGRKLQDVWSMTKIRDVIRDGRTIWGNDWRKGDFDTLGVALAQKDAALRQKA